MYILTVLIAWIQMRGSELLGNAWMDAFLNKMVGVEGWFLAASWWVWGIIVAVTIIAAVLSLLGTVDLSEMSVGCGCIAGILLLWPLLEWISYQLVSGMANSFDPVQGVVNAGSFVICLLLYLWLGAG